MKASTGRELPLEDAMNVVRSEAGKSYDPRIVAILDRRYQPTWNQTTAPLTDDFAPVEYLKAIDRHNERQT